jgi:hypothetical protein
MHPFSLREMASAPTDADVAHLLKGDERGWRRWQRERVARVIAEDLRDLEHVREVDFVVLRDRRPEFAVECKTGERGPSPAAAYFRARTPIPRFYQVHLGSRDYGSAENGVRVLPFRTFCTELGLP